MGYRESGYLPEAVVNFLALLGWNPGDNREVMTREELIEAFSLDKCSKSGAKFDFEKGKWFNHRYLQEASVERIAALFTPVLEQHHVDDIPANLESILSVVRDRVQLIPQLWDETYFFFMAPEEYDEKTVKKRWKAESSLQMREIIDLLNAQPAFESEALGEALNTFIQTKEYSMGGVMNALRLALVGAPKGPHINEILYLLGREESIRRIERAIAQLG